MYYHFETMSARSTPLEASSDHGTMEWLPEVSSTLRFITTTVTLISAGGSQHMQTWKSRHPL